MEKDDYDDDEGYNERIGINEADQLMHKRKKLFKNDEKQLPMILDEIHLRQINIKRDIYFIGGALTDAKKIVGHGNFKKWIEDNLDFSYSTANNLMRVYEVCLGRPEIVESFNPSVLYTMAAPGFPKDLRQYLFDNSDSLDEIENDKLKDIYTRFKSGDLDLDSPEVKNLVKYNKNLNNSELYKSQIKKNIEILKNLKNYVDNAAKKMDWPIWPSRKSTVFSKEEELEIHGLLEDILKCIKDRLPQKHIVASLNIKSLVSDD
jgi:hypothetical protein